MPSSIDMASMNMDIGSAAVGMNFLQCTCHNGYGSRPHCDCGLQNRNLPHNRHTHILAVTAHLGNCKRLTITAGLSRMHTYQKSNAYTTPLTLQWLSYRPTAQLHKFEMTKCQRQNAGQRRGSREPLACREKGVPLQHRTACVLLSAAWWAVW